MRLWQPETAVPHLRLGVPAATQLPQDVIPSSKTDVEFNSR